MSEEVFKILLKSGDETYKVEDIGMTNKFPLYRKTTVHFR